MTAMKLGEDIRVDISNGGVCYSGKDGVTLFRAMTIRSGLGLYLKTGLKPSRGWSLMKMLAVVTEYTGETYKRTHGTRALADLDLWIAKAKQGVQCRT